MRRGCKSYTDSYGNSNSNSAARVTNANGDSNSDSYDTAWITDAYTYGYSDPASADAKTATHTVSTADALRASGQAKKLIRSEAGTREATREFFAFRGGVSLRA